MKTKLLLLLPIVLTLTACTRFVPGHAKEESGPYIDSLGLRASLARIDNVSGRSAGVLIKQALEVPGDGTQPDFFQSLEDNYQKYLTLFKLKNNGNTPEVRCDYDLLATFRIKIFDPQPFMNAILHTLALREITTLDYAVQSDASDTLLVQVSWAKATEQQTGKGFGITEGSLSLLITKHAVSPAGTLPNATVK